MDPISGFDGYDQMMLGQAETEINEPTTSQSSEMPTPYASNDAEEQAFNALAAGGVVTGSLAADAPAAPSGWAAMVQAEADAVAKKAAAEYNKRWIKAVPNSTVIVGVALVAAFMLLRKKA
jgi:hypothetical protein